MSSMGEMPHRNPEVDSTLTHRIYKTVLESDTRLTPRAVEALGRTNFNIDGKTVRRAVHALITEGSIQYT
ncbi:MAG: hypothetical protein AB1659_00280, partial [Thermodesulfobacteriota bacterium]